MAMAMALDLALAMAMAMALDLAMTLAMAMALAIETINSQPHRKSRLARYAGTERACTFGFDSRPGANPSPVEAPISRSFFYRDWDSRKENTAMCYGICRYEDWTGTCQNRNDRYMDDAACNCLGEPEREFLGEESEEDE